MKAVVITKSGGPEILALREVEEPRPSAGELLVAVRATALNRADLLQRRGLYPAPSGVKQEIPGLEAAGEVESVGAKVSLYRPGDRVMGLLPGEGHAEKIVLPERMAMAIPANLGYEEAAAIPEVFLTAYDALFLQLKASAGERILIHAVGSGVGTAALQLAKVAGAVVFGTAGSEEKLEQARQLGLDYGINYRKADFNEAILNQTGGRGVDAIVDLVGASHWEKNLDCLAEKGRIIVVGLVGGSRAEVDLAILLKKRLRIFGTSLRSRALEEKIALSQEFQKRVLPLFESGELRAIVDRVFPLAEIADAHRYMEENRNFGKIVIRVE